MPRTHITRTIAALAAFFLVAASRAHGAEGGFVLPSVRLFDATDGRVVAPRTIVVAGDRIDAVEEDEATARERRPDLPVLERYRGAFVLPGLVDAHVHTAGSAFDPLFLAHGVTAVRDLGAYEEAAFSRRDEAAHDPQRPLYLVVGPIVDGDPPVWPFSATPSSPDEARQLVARLARRGACAVKVYSRLDPSVHRAVVEAAHEIGLPVVGHVPAGLDALAAVEAGQDEIEHLDGVVDLLVAEEIRPRDSTDRWRRGTELWAAADPGRFARVARAFADRGTVHCPTLVVLERTDRLGDPALEEEPLLEFVTEPWRSMWRAAQERGSADFAERAEVARAASARRLGFVQALFQAGAPLLVGSDTPNPYVVPGASLLQEIRFFAEAGIPAAEVLRMATAGNAEILGVGDRAGKVLPGRPADLVVFDGDPTEDLAALDRIVAVSRLGDLRTPQEWLTLLEEQSPGPTTDGTGPADLPPLEQAAGGKRLFRVRYEGRFAGRPAGGEEAFAVEGPGRTVRIVADTISTFPVETRTRYDLLYDAEGDPLRCVIRVRRGGSRWTARYVLEGTTLLGVVEGPHGRKTVELEVPGRVELGTQCLAAGYVRALWGDRPPRHAVRFDETSLEPIVEELPPIEESEVERELPIGKVRGTAARLAVEQGGMKFDVEFFREPGGVPLEMVVRLPFGEFRLTAVEFER